MDPNTIRLTIKCNKDAGETHFTPNNPDAIPNLFQADTWPKVTVPNDWFDAPKSRMGLSLLLAEAVNAVPEADWRTANFGRIMNLAVGLYFGNIWEYDRESGDDVCFPIAEAGYLHWQKTWC